MSSSTRPLLVALTGGIGCGKTTVLHHFQQLGIPCFVADQVAGNYYTQPDFLKQIRSLFGDQVFQPNGDVDKLAIARIVFSDTHALARLNALIHPRVWEDFQRFVQSNSLAPYVIFGSAIAYEYSFDKMVDRVVCVYLEEKERLRRLQLRDHATREQLQARMNNQLSAEEKMMRAHYVVLNYEGNPRERQVKHIHQQLINNLHS